MHGTIDGIVVDVLIVWLSLTFRVVHLSRGVELDKPVLIAFVLNEYRIARAVLVL